MKMSPNTSHQEIHLLLAIWLLLRAIYTVEITRHKQGVAKKAPFQKWLTRFITTINENVNKSCFFTCIGV